MIHFKVMLYHLRWFIISSPLLLFGSMALMLWLGDTSVIYSYDVNPITESYADYMPGAVLPGAPCYYEYQPHDRPFCIIDLSPDDPRILSIYVSVEHNRVVSSHVVFVRGRVQMKDVLLWFQQFEWNVDPEGRTHLEGLVVYRENQTRNFSLQAVVTSINISPSHHVDDEYIQGVVEALP